jgi:hypothetical protein
VLLFDDEEFAEEVDAQLEDGRILLGGGEVAEIHSLARTKSAGACRQARLFGGHFRAAGGKSDAFDAFCLAELARTDHHRFRVLAPDSGETKALRALARAREDLVRTRGSLTNRLCAELEAFWPGAARVFYLPLTPMHLQSRHHRDLYAFAARRLVYRLDGLT